MRRILAVAQAGVDAAQDWEAELWDARFAQVDEALALAVRTGNPHAEETFRSCRQLVRVLRGRPAYIPRPPHLHQHLLNILGVDPTRPP
jgi:hypothetical protein